MNKKLSENNDSPSSRRYLALRFPFLPVDRWRRACKAQTSAETSAKQDERPVVIIEKVKSALRIVHVDQRAAWLGLTQGMTLADARARVPDLVVSEAAASADADYLAQLAALCGRFTPLVALDAPGGLLLDITGCAHLFGGEGGLRTQAATILARQGLSVRACIAGTPDAARALAQFSRIAIAPTGEVESLVCQLPVAALAGLSDDTVRALSRAGLKRIGDLAERPPEVLAARFGQSLITCLNRTLGREDVRITPLRAPAAVVVERHFFEPLTQATSIDTILAELIAEAARILMERGQGGRMFEASFFRSDGVVRQLVVETARSSRDIAAIQRLYRERLDSLADPLDPGFGFDAFRLTVPMTEPLSTAQLHLDKRVTATGGVADLIDRLVVRFGQDRILRFQPRDTHNPDHAARLVPAARARTMSGRSAEAWPVLEPEEPPMRPIQIFDVAQPIDVIAEVPSGPPVRFRWRRVLYVIARAEGPEAIAPAWWRQPSAVKARHYYRVEDRAGCRFSIFREGAYGESATAPRWYLHGIFA